MATAPDSPGVGFPPPFLYAAAVLGGVFLERAVPWPMGLAPWTDVVTVALAAAGLALTAASIGRFWVARTSILPIRPANTLVISGPYHFTRNPMYLGLLLLTLAFALFFDTWWIVVLALPAVILLQVFVIAPEERYLRRRFGDAYEAYTRRVRRWI